MCVNVRGLHIVTKIRVRDRAPEAA
jgi:hypothetical protein